MHNTELKLNVFLTELTISDVDVCTPTHFKTVKAYMVGDRVMLEVTSSGSRQAF